MNHLKVVKKGRINVKGLNRLLIMNQVKVEKKVVKVS